MTTLTAFLATLEWQELPEVSGVAGDFTLFNKSKVNEFQYQINSSIPTNDEDSFDCQPRNAVYISNPDAEKIYVKSMDNKTLPSKIKNVLIAINKG